MTGRTNTIAAMVTAHGDPWRLVELAIDEPRGDEVLIRVEAVGMCHADGLARTGGLPVPAPLVAGHEGAGVVEAVGPEVRELRTGDRVVLTFDSCGRCPLCAAGVPTQCREFSARNFTAGTRPDGSTRLRHDGRPVNGNFFGQSSFATYCLATERNTVRVGDGVPTPLLAPVGCAVQTGFGSVTHVLAPPQGEPVVVFGAGAVGLAAVMTAALDQRDIVVVDTRPGRLELARALGATHVIDAERDDPGAAVRDLLGGGAPFVLESSGAPAALSAAIDVLAVGGTVAVVGTSGRGTSVPVDVVDLVGNSKRIIGVVEGACRPEETIPVLVDLIADGLLPVDRLVTTFPLAEIDEADRAVRSGEVVKAVLLPHGAALTGR